MKQRLNINVDAQVYMLAKAAHVNLSDLINDLLLQYFNTQEVTADQASILHDIQVVREELTERQDRLQQLSVMLVQVQERQAKEQKDCFEAAEKQLATVKASGIMDHIGEDVFR